MITQVKIDLDKPTGLEFLKTYYNLKYVLGDGKFECFRSASGCGFHFVSCKLDIDFCDLMGLRYALYDDPKRCYMDMCRYFLGSGLLNVLFRYKRGKVRREHKIWI